MMCPRCETETKVKNRSFSDQAQAALLIWGELEEQHVDKALCDDCYEDLRDTLIERASEVVDPEAKEVIQAS